MRGGENRVYSRRRGRMTSGQTRALAELLPRYLIDLPPGPLDRDFWDDAFGRHAPLAVEIGFGNGAALAQTAKTHGDWNCIGVDVYQPGFGALLLACERDEIDNVRIVDAEGTAFLRRLPAASLQAIHVYFPDPWPKKRHHKRRLVDPQFAAAAARSLAKDGRLALATDWAEYAERMVEVLDAEPGLAGGATSRPASRPVTPFEAKAIKAGRRVVDLAYGPTGRPQPV